MAKNRKSPGTNYAFELIKPTAIFIRSNFFPLFIKFLGLGFLALAISVAVGLVLVYVTAFLFPLLGIPAGSMDLLWSDRLAFIRQLIDQPIILAIALLWVCACIGLVLWSYQSISFASFVMIKERFEGKRTSVWAIISRIRSKVLGYQVYNVAFLALFLFVFPLIANLILGYEAILFLESPGYAFFSFASACAILFLTQFWLWEQLIAGRDLSGALTANISIIRRNLLKVVIFDLFSCLSRSER